MSQEARKKIDENWKAQVEKEKKRAQLNREPYHEPTFTVFLSSISMQAMVAMGKLQNPVTGKTEKNMDQARFLIDTLGILKEKTKGNLTLEEENLLNESLFNLRLLYVQEKERGK
jgi:hypothetical protein